VRALFTSCLATSVDGRVGLLALGQVDLGNKESNNVSDDVVIYVLSACGGVSLLSLMMALPISEAVSWNSLQTNVHGAQRC
jgi:hypothetical protein